MGSGACLMWVTTGQVISAMVMITLGISAPNFGSSYFIQTYPGLRTETTIRSWIAIPSLSVLSVFCVTTILLGCSGVFVLPTLSQLPTSEAIDILNLSNHLNLC